MECSADKKLGPASATYASIKLTCQSSCAFYPRAHPTKDNTLRGTKFTCYAMSGNVRMHVTRLNSGDAEDAIAAALEEAQAISDLTGRHPLRLHVSGDCLNEEAARIIAAACAAYTAKHGCPVWAYTHSWRVIPREAWGGINIRASLQWEHEIAEAKAQGYGSFALAYATKKEKPLVHGFDFAGEHFAACPQESGRVADCVSCGICLNTNIHVGFHGHDGARHGQTETVPLTVIESNRS